MEFRARSVVVTVIAAAMLPGVVPGQATGETVKVQSCAKAHRTGQRIVSNMEIVEFDIPRSAHMTRVTDIDYEKYYVRFGRKQDKLWINFMFGALVSGFKPRELENTSITWTAHKWGCHNDDDGTDWHGIGTDGRRWRHISIPFGFAAYEGVPPNAADYFDKILDTICCGKCPTCKK
jgi:hypothetical protein